MDLVTGAFGNALLLLEQMLTKDPADTWARERRREAVENVEKLARAARARSGNKQ